MGKNDYIRIVLSNCTFSIEVNWKFQNMFLKWQGQLYPWFKCNNNHFNLMSYALSIKTAKIRKLSKFRDDNET